MKPSCVLSIRIFISVSGVRSTLKLMYMSPVYSVSYSSFGMVFTLSVFSFAFSSSLIRFGTDGAEERSLNVMKLLFVITSGVAAS